MKTKLKRLLISMTVVFVVFNCSQEKIVKPIGQLQFSFSSNAVNSGGRVESTATPSFALLSIKDSQGNLVQSSKKLTLYSFGGSFVTESLQISVGNFALTQFMILDSANNVLYATPMEGSVLAKYVNDPLPVNFSITENGTTLVTPQVLAVTPLTKPDAFGYVSFGFEVVTVAKPKLKEFWQDEPFGFLYKTYYTYSGELPVKSITYYYYANNATLLDSGVFHYTNQGQLSEEITYWVFNPAPPIIKSYQYDGNGVLKKMLFAGDASSNNSGFDYSYPSNTSITAVRSLNGSSTNYGHQQYEYTTNDKGDVTNVSIYSVSQIGKTLMFQANYAYDNELNPFAFERVYNSPIPNRHNIISFQLVGYNISNGVLVVSDSCTSHLSYKYNTTGLPVSAIVLNPNGCTENDFDGTKYTYIYE